MGNCIKMGLMMREIRRMSSSMIMKMKMQVMRKMKD